MSFWWVSNSVHDGTQVIFNETSLAPAGEKFFPNVPSSLGVSRSFAPAGEKLIPNIRTFTPACEEFIVNISRSLFAPAYVKFIPNIVGALASAAEKFIPYVP